MPVSANVIVPTGTSPASAGLQGAPKYEPCET